MKCPSLLLIFGVLLPSFYLHCEAFKYRDLRHHGRSLLDDENTVDEVRYHRYRRNALLRNDTDCAGNKSLSCNDTTIKERHKYYVSEIIKNGKNYWVDVTGNENHNIHPYLSDSYLLRQPYKLKFQFPYYGHLLDEVMITTGGFLYMDVHDTKLMTQVQYLAPLMAYFNPHLGDDSTVSTLDDESKLTVEWSNVRLHENATADKRFTFQCTLHKDGRIWFAYKQIPIKVGDIRPLPYHPVKVGIADAFVIKRRDTRSNILYRLFYIYSAINITKDSVVNNAAVIFRPLLSCVGAQTCTECIERTAETNFSCAWCTKTEKCSDGVDRHRQEWEENDCGDNSIEEMNDVCFYGPVKEERKTNEKKGLGAGAIFGIVLLLVLVIGIAAWCVYAYRYPTSKSGLFFIEATRRPREFFRRSPGTSGTTADPSDVKPQVL